MYKCPNCGGDFQKRECKCDLPLSESALMKDYIGAIDERDRWKQRADTAESHVKQLATLLVRFCSKDTGQSKQLREIASTYLLDHNLLPTPLNGEHQLQAANVRVPKLSTGCPPLCEGCGSPKLYAGKEASSLVCCNDCYRKLPKWLKKARMGDGSMVWENRLALMLVWMREADTPNGGGH